MRDESRSDPAVPEPDHTGTRSAGPEPDRRMDFAASLLRGLFVQRLDPGYEEASRRRGGRPARGPAQLAWVVMGALLVGVVFAVAALDAARRAPGTETAQRSLAEDVREARAQTDELGRRAAELAREIDAARRSALRAGPGQAELERLAELEQATGATGVTGPGLRVTVDDPEGRNVLDRDLQVLVNALWSAGAEAMSVGGVRLQPRATVRQAGGAMLVDNRPIRRPYVLEAIGAPDQMHTRFVNTDGYGRFNAFTQLYGTTFAVERVETLRLPAASPGQPRVAAEPGATPPDVPSQEGPR
ncbi:UPF0749 protein [Longimycelium tulufanense]|uniref:UPF0749 protein n=1 Tax=Longimycelium tulufanense TaxID=907463 RepID=A0A8J3C8L1_9PSEU|nr:DUF881 domain-containing protein [Longimycelium tulufanense]GGM56541.1 UPF0749 protein [Longimycelium tulufanense]